MREITDMVTFASNAPSNQRQTTFRRCVMLEIAYKAGLNNDYRGKYYGLH